MVHRTLGCRVGLFLALSTSCTNAWIPNSNQHHHHHPIIRKNNINNHRRRDVVFTSATATPSNEVVLTTTAECNRQLQYLANRGDVTAAEEMVQDMKDLCGEQNNDNNNNKSDTDEICTFSPDLSSYYALLEAHAKNRWPDGQRAMELLEHLETHEEWEPDARAYRFVMQALLRETDNDENNNAKGKSSKKQTQRQQQQQQPKHNVSPEIIYQRAVDRGVAVTAPLQSCLLEVYHKQLQPQKAQDLLDGMEELGWANSISYGVVLKAWRDWAADDNHNQQQVRGSTAADRALALLTRMEERKMATIIAYTTTMGVIGLQGTAAAAQQVQDLLERMRENAQVVANTQAYNVVLQAWVQAQDLERAEQVLADLEQLADRGEGHCRPDAISYSTVMNGYSKSYQFSDRLERVENLWNRLVRRYKENGDTACRPTRICYTIAVLNYCRDPKALDNLERAEELLYQMYDDYVKKPNPEARPNTQLVTTVLDAWSKSGVASAGARAQTILEWHVDIYQKDPHNDWRPNEYSFASTITAWSRSQRTLGKAHKAHKLLSLMSDLYRDGVLASGPNIYCYTSVLAACARCEAHDALDKKQAIQVAIGVYQDLERQEKVEPNHVAYSTLLKVFRLLPPGPQRTAAATRVLNQAIAGGYVDLIVCNVVQDLFDPTELRIFLRDRGEDQFLADMWSLSEIPEAWSRKVPRRR